MLATSVKRRRVDASITHASSVCLINGVQQHPTLLTQDWHPVSMHLKVSFFISFIFVLWVSRSLFFGFNLYHHIFFLCIQLNKLNTFQVSMLDYYSLAILLIISIDLSIYALFLSFITCPSHILSITYFHLSL